MPLFDYKCPRCGRIREDVLVRNSDELVFCDNPKHQNEAAVFKAKMKKLPAAPSFKVKGFASVNGYSGGQTKEHKVPGEPNMRVVVKS